MHFKLRRKAMYIVLALAYQMVFLQGMVMTIVAKDLMRELDLTPDRMGMLGSTYLYAYAAVMLCSGMLAAWVGPHRLLSGLFLISGAGGLLFANSHSLGLAMLGRALSGVGLAATMTSSFTLFGRWYPPSAYPRVCSYFFACGGFGALAGIGLLAPLNAAWGWRAVFTLIACLTLAYSLLLAATVRDWPPGDAEISPGQPGQKRNDVTPAILWQSVKQVVRNADFWRLVVWFASLPGIYFGFIGLWAIPYFKDVYNMSDAQAGGLACLAGLGFIVGSPLVAWLSENVWHSQRLTVGASGVAAMAMVLPLIFLTGDMNGTGLVLLILCLGMTLNAPNVCAYAAARNLFGTRMAGITGGVFGCVTFIAGSAMQILCGVLLGYAQNRNWSQAESYGLAFTPFLLCGLVAAVAGFTLSPKSDAG